MTLTLDRPATELDRSHDPVDDASRREFLAGGLAAGLILAGCGEDEPADPSTRTRRVRHAFGATDVPLSPQRVAAFANSAADVAVALDVELVAADEQSLAFDYLTRRGLEAESFGNLVEPNLEAVAALGPDLIVGFFPEELYGRLSRIAPSVGVSFGESSVEWPRYGREVAVALAEDGRRRFDALLSAHRERARALGARVRDARGDDLTVAILRTEAEGGGRYDLRATFPGTVVYGELGLELPAGLRDVTEARLDVSAEQLGRGDADVLFVYTPAGPASEPGEELSQLRDNPVFRRLRAVRSGDVHVVGAHWFGGSTIAANLVVDDLERILLGGGGS